MQRGALCRSRRELSNEYLLAKIGIDTAENEPLEFGGNFNSLFIRLLSCRGNTTRRGCRRPLAAFTTVSTDVLFVKQIALCFCIFLSVTTQLAPTHAEALKNVGFLNTISDKNQKSFLPCNLHPAARCAPWAV